ncbi:MULTISPECIES: DUF4390 domain-containing protein [Giesbergeria]|uniref:DUF4390 domain-containing protein n=1 Tax=Giesbergeria sinuosa TaxID=80883 RepID=A0ABV9QH42_9BURK
MPERTLRRRWGIWWLWGWLCCGLVLWSPLLGAQPTTDALELRVYSSPEGLHLSTELPVELPKAIEDALQQGIPLFFVAEAQVLRQRWYWSAQTVAQTVRYMRLSYQPLTRRWRLVVSPSPIDRSGLGVVPGNNHDSLAEALAAMKRIARWKIADAPALEAGGQYVVQLRFRLDTSQLPRTLQVGMLGRSSWNLVLQGSQPVLWELAP